jgi:hypothetical protein
MSFKSASHITSFKSEEAAQMWEGSTWNKFEKSRGKFMDRSNSFIGSRSRTSTSAGKFKNDAFSFAMIRWYLSVDTLLYLEHEEKGCIVIVDPFSTGAHLASDVCKAGYKCARVFSAWDSPVAALIQQGLIIDYCATIQYNDRAGDVDTATNEVNTFKFAGMLFLTNYLRTFFMTVLI